MLSERLFYEIGLFITLKKNNLSLKDLEIICDDPLTFKLLLNIKEHNYNFEVIFPRFFPFQPIIVKNKEEKRLSKHEYNDKTMCLKWGIDNWNENITIKNIIENLIELLEVENPYGEEHGIAENGDEFSFSQTIVRNANTLLIDHETFDLFNKEKGSGEFLIKKTDLYNLFFVSKIDNKKIKQLVKTKNRIEFEYWNLNDKGEIDGISNDVLLSKYLKEKECCLIHYKEEKKYLLLRKVLIPYKIKKNVIESIPEEQHDSFLKDPVYRIESIAIKFIDDEKKKRLNIEYNVLSKKIAIMGLGSIGSRVLLDLSRAGFNNFLLCDDDIFLPNNIIRHELDEEHIGEYKIEALAKKVKKSINPKAKFELDCFALNGQESSNHTNRLFEQLSTCELIIDCTADSNLIFSLNEIINKIDINYISGSVLNGGVGNVLIKREKGSNLSLIDIVESQKKFFNINNFDFSRAHDYSGMIGDTEYIATMSDCSIIAGLIGKNAINMLLDKKDEILKNDIYVMSTSNNFLDESYACYPLIAHERDYTPKKLNKSIVILGRKYYENYRSRKNV